MASSNVHQGDSTNGQEGPQDITEIDPDGDLTLAVGANNIRFLVCSKTLSRSAPFWKTCLYGPFLESRPAAGQDWEVKLPEDNPRGLHILLLLVHGLGHKLPPINLRLAFETTVLSNKYGMTHALWAVAKTWLQDLKPNPPNVLNGTIVPQLWWLWVTKELGGSDQHGLAFVELSQMICTTDDGEAHVLLRHYYLSHRKILNKMNLGGYDAEKDVVLLMAENIKLARQKAMERIQFVLKCNIAALQNEFKDFTTVMGLQNALVCSANRDLVSKERRWLCQYAMQAIVDRFSAAKDSPVKPLSEIGLSVKIYLARVVEFTARIEREIAYVSDDNHQKCTPFTTSIPSKHVLKEETLSKWKAENLDAFQIQARVSGLEKSGTKT